MHVHTHAHTHIHTQTHTQVVSEPTRVQGLPKCVAVSCGGTHTLALTASGDVMVFGANAQGQCGLSEAPYKVDTPLPLTGRLDGRRVLALAAGGGGARSLSHRHARTHTTHTTHIRTRARTYTHTRTHTHTHTQHTHAARASNWR